MNGHETEEEFDIDAWISCDWHPPIRTRSVPANVCSAPHSNIVACDICGKDVPRGTHGLCIDCLGLPRTFVFGCEYHSGAQTLTSVRLDAIGMCEVLGDFAFVVELILSMKDGQGPTSAYTLPGFQGQARRNGESAAATVVVVVNAADAAEGVEGVGEEGGQEEHSEGANH